MTHTSVNQPPLQRPHRHSVLRRFYHSSVGQKNDRRDHRHHFDPVRHRPFARQSANFSRPGLDQRLLATSARSRAAALVHSPFPARTVIMHIYVTIRLAIENRRARPEAYIDKEYVKATFASRHMVDERTDRARFSSFITLPISPSARPIARFALLKPDPLDHYDVYSMMVYGFQNSTSRAFTCSDCSCSRFI